jgi:hypothetical protein
VLRGLKVLLVLKDKKVLKEILDHKELKVL